YDLAYDKLHKRCPIVGSARACEEMLIGSMLDRSRVSLSSPWQAPSQTSKRRLTFRRIHCPCGGCVGAKLTAASQNAADRMRLATPMRPPSQGKSPGAKGCLTLYGPWLRSS